MILVNKTSIPQSKGQLKSNSSESHSNNRRNKFDNDNEIQTIHQREETDHKDEN